MSELTLGSLAESGALELNDGYRTKKAELGQPGVPILRVAEVLDGRIAPTFGDHVREDFRSKFRRKTSMTGDVVVTTKGTVGRVARIARTDPEFVYSPQVCYLRVLDQSVLDEGWLYQWTRGPEFRRQTVSVQDQTDMAAYVNLVDLRATRISVPPLVSQRAIAEVLGALDDKIEANRQLAQLCDATWRVSLEAAETGVLHSLSSLAHFINGRAFTKDASGYGRIVVRIAELNGDPGPSTVYNDIEVPEEHTARPGDLLFAWSGSLTVRRWFRPTAIVNQHIFKVIPKPNVPLWFVHACLLKVLPVFRGIAADKATTMGHIQRHHLDELVLVPEPVELGEMDRYCGPLWERALAAERESLALSALRDALLPRLLSGALRVRDAERAVSEAV
jgi:type I restriction enzyme S subunit